MNKRRVFIQIALSACAIFLICGCISQNYTKSINDSQKLAYDSMVHDIAKSVNHIKSERNITSVRELMDSAINALMGDKSRDTIFVVEKCTPKSKVYCALIWNKNKELLVRHRFDIFEMDTTPCIDYRMKQLISEWDTSKIIKTSNLNVVSYYQKHLRLNCATRLIVNKRKCIDTESLIFREIDFDSDITPTFFD